MNTNVSLPKSRKYRRIQNKKKDSSTNKIFKDNLLNKTREEFNNYIPTILKKNRKRKILKAPKFKSEKVERAGYDDFIENFPKNNTKKTEVSNHPNLNMSPLRFNDEFNYSDAFPHIDYQFKNYDDQIIQDEFCNNDLFFDF